MPLLDLKSLQDSLLVLECYVRYTAQFGYKLRASLLFLLQESRAVLEGSTSPRQLPLIRDQPGRHSGLLRGYLRVQEWILFQSALET